MSEKIQANDESGFAICVFNGYINTIDHWTSGPDIPHSSILRRANIWFGAADASVATSWGSPSPTPKQVHAPFILSALLLVEPLASRSILLQSLAES
eukprot:m.197945 g.197945  ORF g.197945 m.197945 type:complete len:97 (-) comp32672_c0_seq1:1904-2194(-)